MGKRFIDYTERLIYAATGVVTPLTASLHASGEHEGQRKRVPDRRTILPDLDVIHGRGLVLFGRSLIVLWLGPRMSEAATLLTILALGELVPLSQSVSGTVLLGMARHRIIAWFGFAEILSGSCWRTCWWAHTDWSGSVSRSRFPELFAAGWHCSSAVAACFRVPVAELWVRRRVASALDGRHRSACGRLSSSVRSHPQAGTCSWDRPHFMRACYAVGALTILTPEHRGLLLGGLKRRLFPA